jgi:hypothetical protein
MKGVGIERALERETGVLLVLDAQENVPLEVLHMPVVEVSVRT